MPTYQYACTQCDHRFEAVQAFSDATLTDCPQCHGHLRKVYGSVGVVFKGSGFYRTDSRAGAGKASLTADHKSEKSGDGTAKSDSTSSKPAASEKHATAPSSSSSGASVPAKAAS